MIFASFQVFEFYLNLFKPGLDMWRNVTSWYWFGLEMEHEPLDLDLRARIRSTPRVSVGRRSRSISPAAAREWMLTALRGFVILVTTMTGCGESRRIRVCDQRVSTGSPVASAGGRRGSRGWRLGSRRCCRYAARKWRGRV
jgi:hypothetical protein